MLDFLSPMPCQECKKFRGVGIKDKESIQMFRFCPVCGRNLYEESPLSVVELRLINAETENRSWIWIQISKHVESGNKVSAYYQSQLNYTHGRAFCCGYPGLGFCFEYSDYGKTWLAYLHKPEGE